MVDLGTRPPDSGTEGPPPDRSKGRPRRSLWILLGLLAAFVIYAYGFRVTEVSLDKIQDETRQEQLFRVLRALAQPDLLTYETEAATIDLEYAVPCPPGGFEPAPLQGEVIFTVSPPCAEPREVVTVRAAGLRPNQQARVFFVPPSDVQLRLADIRTDAGGGFEAEVRIPARPDDQMQKIRLLTTQTVGSIFDPEYVELENGEVVRSPRWSKNAIDTYKLIIETVFLALLATTWGTAIAVPLSFFAARNLMRDVRIPPLQLGLAIVGIPLGLVLGLAASNGSESVVTALPESLLLLGALALALLIAMIRLLPIAVPVPSSGVSRSARIAAGLGAAAAFLFAAQAVVRLALIGGAMAAEGLGPFAFLGEFVVIGGEVLATGFDLVAALAGAGTVAYLGSKTGYQLGRRLLGVVRTGLAVLAGGAAGALIALAFGQVVAWLYRIVDTQATVAIPAMAGGAIGAVVAWWGTRRGQVSIGLAVYYVARTVFNTLRSIEALVLALVFVIWVGLGPFAGALALALHTVAANAKLYSEQVESINPGPLEAIRATGATRLQTVVYGVVPQIVAPYISFTMYRWDINVRMSTIIGFVGGGGIGFLLQQNIGLLNYRAAAAQMLAIAIVVATMDWLSSRLRERFV